MGKRDPQGYYAALSVSPAASRQEIRLAYEFLKQAVKQGKRLDIAKAQAAYETLGDRRQREQYDQGTSSRKRSGANSRMHSIPLLLTLTVVFLGVLALALAPQLRAHLVSFDVGNDLYWRSTNKPLGVVVDFDADHEFPGGAAAPAYRVRTTSDGEPIWFPARDLNAHCGVRR